MSFIRTLIIMMFLLSACSMEAAQQSTVIPSARPVVIAATGTPSATDAIQPSSTPRPTSTTSDAPTSGAACQRPGDWIPYTIGPGDTLGAIATRTNTTVQALTDGNCLTNANLINAGQQIYIPPVNTNPRPLPVGSIGFEGAPLEISPVLNTGAGFVDVQANAPISLRWSTIPAGSVRIDFMLYPATATGTQTVIATDTNLADGASGIWQVPAQLDVMIYAIGFDSIGNWTGFSDHRRVVASAGVGSNCVPNANWQNYTIRAGDQLEYLAVVGGVSVGDVLRGNCWFDSTPFVTGAVMRLPVLPYVPPTTVAIDTSRCMHNSPGTFGPRIEPVLAVDLTLQCYHLDRGSRVRITLPNLPANTHTVEFFWSVPGPNPFTIGTTTDVSSGTATIMWDVPDNEFMGQIYANVYRVEGGLLESNTVGVYAR